jgi:outer membrane protein TolC
MKMRSCAGAGLIVLVSAGLSGCATVPDGWGREAVDVLLDERGLEIIAATEQLADALLAEPLDADAAVRLALIGNPAIRRRYAELGFGAADIYQAGRLSNPGLSLSRLDPRRSGDPDQTTLGLSLSFTDLLLLPTRSRLAADEFERLQHAVGAEVQQVTIDVTVVYYHLVGARQQVRMHRALVTAAQALADLSERFFQAGNINRMTLALERAAHSEARLAYFEAQVDARVAEEELRRMMGIATGRSFDVVNGLPAPADLQLDLAHLLAVADESRLDLEAARRRVMLAADVLGVTRRWRYLGEIEVGFERERESDGGGLNGPTLALELPLFDQHLDERVRAEVELQLSEIALDALTTRAASEVFLAHAEVEVTQARLQELRDVLLPLREEIVARAQEQVNFMLLGVFDLLRLKQEEYETYSAYLDSVRDYWIARTELQGAVGRRLDLPSASGPPIVAPDPGSTSGSSMEGMDHSEQGGAGGPQEAAPIADPHAGHQMQEPEPAPSPDPHAGHQMQEPEPAPPPDSHAGHDMGGMNASDPPAEPEDADEPPGLRVGHRAPDDTSIQGRGRGI